MPLSFPLKVNAHVKLMACRVIQVMIQTFCMCTVWGEPLSQTAQSFMPGLINGVNRSLDKVRIANFNYMPIYIADNFGCMML